MALVVTALLFVVLFLVAASLFGGALAPGAPTFFLVPFCGVFLVAILVMVLALAGGAGRQTLPPPPPIQQPMVPGGTQGAVELACPNCGAPPTNVDRFGVATCAYCSTRFLVR